MHTMKSVVGIALAVLLACGLSQAQDARVLPKHPGDTIKFEVRFEGPNADKIKTIGAGLNKMCIRDRSRAYGRNGSRPGCS